MMEQNHIQAYNIEQSKRYRVLLRDFLIVNLTSGAAMLIMFAAMLLQRYGILPSLPCGIHDIFHIYCPGCGGTRAVFELLHGNILLSLYYNPAIFFGVLLILYYEIGVVITLTKRNGRYYYYRKGGLVYGYMAIVAVFTVFRNCLLLGPGIDMLGDFV